ncbi:MAG: phage minor capsid protein [Clostridia bacterium]
MLSDAQLEALLAPFEARMRAVNARYLEKIGQHLRDIGRMRASDISRLTEMKRMGADVDQLKRAIAKEMNASEQAVEAAFLKVAEDDYQFAEKYYAEGRQMPIRQNKALMRAVRAQARITAREMANLSRTTVVSGAYQHAIDMAIAQVHAGVVDYHGAIRQSLVQAAQEGARVRYESGLTRRLDSAVRQNVLGGVRQINLDVARQTGKAFHADGVEISAHALCAEDHLPYQGRQFSKKEFALLQATIKRPIGLWDCRHMAFPILLGLSPPTYSQDQLDNMAKNSREMIAIDGEVKTRYEWTQAQRRLETAVRYQKDIAVIARASGDDHLRRLAQANIDKMDKRYRRISGAAGIPTQRERMGVAGFHRVKGYDELSDAVKFKGATFEIEKRLDRHVQKHLAEYGSVSADNYVARAESLLRSKGSDDILALTRSDGSIAKYRVSTNEFVVGTRKGKIRTAFKPKMGADYWWNEEVKRNG